jgi:hypothetical protein
MPTLAVGMLEMRENYDMPTASVGMAPVAQSIRVRVNTHPTFDYFFPTDPCPSSNSRAAVARTL